MIRIRRATSEDSDALIALTAVTPMNGRISLRLDRKPNFFQLLKERGDYIAFVAETEVNHIIGSFTACRQSFLVEQQPTNIYYVGDFKVHPDYAGSATAYRLVRRMHDELKSLGADLLFCTAAEGNALVTPFFSGKAGIPLFKKFCGFRVYQILPKKNAARKSLPLHDPFTMEELKSFYKHFYARYSFFPDIKDLESCQHIVMKKDGGIVAAASLIDPAEYKQNVLIRYPMTVGFTLGVLRMLKPLLSLPPLPKKLLPLRILYVKHWATTLDGHSWLPDIIARARHVAYEEGYHFLSIAVDEKDSRINQMMKSLTAFVFNSDGLLASLNGQTALVDRLCTSISYEDYSLV